MYYSFTVWMLLQCFFMQMQQLKVNRNKNALHCKLDFQMAYSCLPSAGHVQDIETVKDI